MNMFIKRRRLLACTFLVLMSIFLLYFYLRSNHHLYCLKTVKNVNDQMKTIGFNRKCTKQRVITPESCNTLQEESAYLATSSVLDKSLDSCSNYLNANKVIFHKDEKDAPLAFSIMTHKDPVQLSKLLSAVHRPWNSYCIQLDSKSSPEFHQLIQKLLNCYNSHYGNTSVILSPHQTSLVWQHSSLLEGDLNCLELLLKERSNWKYYINIVGSEYPIITNFQLIQNLNKISNEIGFVDVGHPWPEVQERWKYSYILPKKKPSSVTSLFGGYYSYSPVKTEKLKTKPPFNLEIMYGIKNVAITRKFANFVIYSKVGKVLRDWLQDTLVAVEHFYSTMATVSMEGWPDGNQDNVTQSFLLLADLNSFKMRKTFWYGEYSTCHGEFKREICNLVFGDLPSIVSTKSFVVNKFETDLDSTIVDCVRELVYGEEGMIV